MSDVFYILLYVNVGMLVHDIGIKLGQPKAK